MYNQTKKYLKELAVDIRKLKNSRKQEFRGNLDILDIELKIQENKYKFRHHHISLCEIYGTSRKKIENPSQSNLPNELYIDKIKKEIIKEHEQETLCNCT